ncbi:MAG: hypothetical protein ABFS45_17560 [Pseudomonadota bacterium]
MFNASRVQRVFLFNLANLNLLAIWLTGFDQMHWFAYVIPAALYFAAASGFCLGFVISKKILDIFGIADKPARSSTASG